MIYDIAQTQVAETGLPSKAIALWFPYVATLMLFIFVINLLGFLPAAVHRRDLPPRPGLGHLRGDLADLGHARARRDDLGLHAHRGDPLTTALVKYFKSLDPARCRRRSCR